MRAGCIAISGILALLLADIASAKDMNLNRTAKSGTDSPLAYSGRWDRNCKTAPNTITVTKQPMNGTVSVVDAEETIPASTPASGSTGQCAGAKIMSKKIMYRSNPNFRGNDAVSYDSQGGGVVIHTTIAISVQ